MEHQDIMLFWLPKRTLCTPYGLIFTATHDVLSSSILPFLSCFDKCYLFWSYGLQYGMASSADFFFHIEGIRYIPKHAIVPVRYSSLMESYFASTENVGKSDNTYVLTSA